MGNDRANSFDAVARAYERMRPGYPEELYERIFAYAPVGEGSHVLEVGIGAGQATPPFLKAGCRVTAVERGERFSRLCREKFRDCPGFDVIAAEFEEAELEEGAFDLVYAASSFHWIPEETGYGKVRALLRPGGAFARFANHPFRDKGNARLSGEIDEIYRRYYYPYYRKEPVSPAEFSGRDAEKQARIAEKYGFTDVAYALFTRTRTFTARAYTELLGTYSDHIAIRESVRREFFAAIESAIDRHGGSYTVYDTIDLELARKR